MSDLVTAKDLWLAQSAGQPYSFEIKVSDQAWRLVTISDPEREPIDWFADRPGSDLDGVLFEPTVRELFEIVFSFEEAKFKGEGALKVSYDDQLGFPSAIQFNTGGFHGAGTILVRNVEFDSQ